MDRFTAEDAKELSQFDTMLDDGVKLTKEQDSRYFSLRLAQREERDWQREIRGYQHDERGDD